MGTSFHFSVSTKRITLALASEQDFRGMGINDTK